MANSIERETVIDGEVQVTEFTSQSEGDRMRLRVAESGTAAFDWPEAVAANYVKRHIHEWEVHLGTLVEYASTLPGSTAGR